MSTQPTFNLALLISAFAGLFYFGILDNGRGPAYPEILRTLSLTNSTGSLLFALTSFLSFLMTIFSHKWLNNLSLGSAMRWGWCFLGIAAFIYGLSGTFISPFLIFLASFVHGIGMGVVSMTMNLVAKAASPISHRRRTFSALHGTYGIASFLAPLLFTFIRSIHLPWNYFFYTIAFLAPLFLIALPKEREKTFLTVPDPDLNIKLPLPFLVLVGLTIGTYVASEIVISSRLVLFLEEGHSLTNKEASYYLSGFFVALMLGRLLMGFKDLPFSSSSILICSLILTGLLLTLGHQGYLFCFSLTGLTMSVFFPAFMDWLAESFPQDFHKTTTYVLSGVGLHLVLMHLGFGYLAEALGVVKAMGLASVLTLISLIFLIISLLWSKRLQPICQRHSP